MPIQTTNIDAATGDAIDTNIADEVLTVAANVIVQSDQANCIGSTNGDATIVNYGQLIASDTGVFSDGPGTATIVNETSGSIVGYYGIYIQETGDKIVNDGSIVGSEAGIIDLTGQSVIQNTGNVFGGYDGVAENSHDELYNSGNITSPSFGVFLQSGSGSSTSADNRGTIQGSEEAVISSGVGSVRLSNEGDIEGNVDLQNTGGDTLTNEGSIRGDVLLGNGTNTFDGRGGTVTGEITGGNRADTIHLGNDGETVNGGGGHDQIYGGTGADTFAFTSDIAANSETIHNFNVKNDTIELDHSTFTKLVRGATPVLTIGTQATSATDHLFYNNVDGALWYDPNGSGAGGVVEIANLGVGLKLTASNFEVV